MAGNPNDQAAKRRARQRRLERDARPATAGEWGASALLVGYPGCAGHDAPGGWTPRIRDIDDAPVIDPPASRR